MGSQASWEPAYHKHLGGPRITSTLGALGSTPWEPAYDPTGHAVQAEAPAVRRQSGQTAQVGRLAVRCCAPEAAEGAEAASIGGAVPAAPCASIGRGEGSQERVR